MMRLRMGSILGLGLIFFVSSLAVSCKHAASFHYTDAPSGEVFFDPLYNFKDPSFTAKWTPPMSDRDKIAYLLDRVAQAKNRFIRNGEYHNGKEAREWLQYKMIHWVNGVKTVDGFISRVASSSQKTGEPYLVESRDGNLYSLKSILKNEHAALENDLAHPSESSAAPTPSSIQTSSSVVS